MTAGDAGLMLLLGGAALLMMGELRKWRRVRMAGVAACLAGCAVTLISLLA